jgi:hypothetical protein
MVRRTWEDRELVLLEAIAIAEQELEEPLVSYALPERTGLDDIEVQRGLRALFEAGFIGGTQGGINQRLFDLENIRLLERGRRTVGQWPPENQFDSFVEVLNERIVSADSDEERSKLERIRDTVGRDVLTSVLSSWARQVGGLP